MNVAQGPLVGVRVVEFTGLGPGPFATMLLSDLGAEVLRIDRRGAIVDNTEITSRGRSSILMDLKSPEDVKQCLTIIERADVLIEGYRPGVMERLGLGPDVALERNPKLIYGRMTGWGQTGPLSRAAGHDINYIAVTGALDAIGHADRPVPPLNLVGDFGGGSLYLALGIASALYEAQKSGRGQVIDAAIIDGAASLMAMSYGFNASGGTQGRGTFVLDGSSHFYRTYECSDGKQVAVGSIEPHFYSLLLEKTGVTGKLQSQAPEDWAENGEEFAKIFRTRTRDEWCALLEGTDACFAPVLSMDEAPSHPQNKERNVFVEEYGVVQPAPAPRFSRTPGAIQGAPPKPGEGGKALANAWGIDI